ncbi:MAG TPA: hypothetical protein VN258_01655 [Mobilitalea sp.]|nr:hypothetical protein [Mobilitalea sp.]
MQVFNMEGFGKITGGQYESIHLEGVSSCSENIKAENLHIEGVFTCSGEIQAGTMLCEGVCDFKSNIRVKKLVVEGVFNEKEGTKIEAEEIVCDGVIKTNGEIYADVLRADGCISAKEIYGDLIKISTHYTVNIFKKIFNPMKSEIKLIEATTIELSGVTVDTVNGRDITIGPNCKVNNIDCNGTIFIDGSSTVGNITGDFARREYK